MADDKSLFYDKVRLAVTICPRPVPKATIDERDPTLRLHQSFALVCAKKRQIVACHISNRTSAEGLATLNLAKNEVWTPEETEFVTELLNRLRDIRINSQSQRFEYYLRSTSGKKSLEELRNLIYTYCGAKIRNRIGKLLQSTKNAKTFLLDKRSVEEAAIDIKVQTEEKRLVYYVMKMVDKDLKETDQLIDGISAKDSSERLLKVCNLWRKWVTRSEPGQAADFWAIVESFEQGKPPDFNHLSRALQMLVGKLEMANGHKAYAYIEKVASYVFAYNNLGAWAGRWGKYADQHENTFLQPVYFPRPGETEPFKESVTVKDWKMILKNEKKEYFPDDKDDDKLKQAIERFKSSSATDETSNRYNSVFVHAEMHLVQQLQIISDSSRLEGRQYIGVSKLCCYLCYKCINNIFQRPGYSIVVKGAHNKVYGAWMIPPHMQKDQLKLLQQQVDGLITSALHSTDREKRNQPTFESDGVSQNTDDPDIATGILPEAQGSMK